MKNDTPWIILALLLGVAVIALFFFRSGGREEEEQGISLPAQQLSQLTVELPTQTASVSGGTPGWMKIVSGVLSIFSSMGSGMCSKNMDKNTNST